jgi:hypothetical protein
MEKAQEEKEAHGEIETQHPGYLGSQDTYYVGTIKGVGRTEYCGKREHHEFQLYLEIEDIDHTRTKVKHPQTNGICERFHQTIQNEFYAIAFRKKIYNALEDLQKDVDAWVEDYNEKRTHQGKYCFGKTPMETFLGTIHLAREKMLGATTATSFQDVA